MKKSRMWCALVTLLVLMATSGTCAPAGGDLYDPSIFIIEAQGTWRQELMEGCFVDYECELYLDKTDPNDNRSADGMYSGALWMKVELNMSDFIKKLMKKTPISVGFDAGGEGICDNLTVNLLADFEREAWQDYAIPGEKGETLPADKALVARGGFIAMAKSAYVKIRASGAQGESFQRSDDHAEDAEMSYIIHVEPGQAAGASERNVLIYLYNAEGVSAQLKGVWRRIDGYAEDVLEYASSGKAREMLDRHVD